MPDIDGPGAGSGAGAGLAARLAARARAVFLRQLMLAAAGCGAVATLAQAPFDLWPLGPLGLAGLFGLFRVAALRGAWASFWILWAGGAGYFAAAMFWIVEPFFIDIARHGWMAPFALVFLSGGLALFWGAAGALACWLSRPGGQGGWGALAWVAALTGAEMLRGTVLTGFPWGLIGYAWAASPAAQYAAVIGPHGLSALALALAVTLWRLATPQWRGALPVLALFVGLIGGGTWLGRPQAPGPDAALIRMVQPNVPQTEKWDPDRVLGHFYRQLDFSAEAGPGRPPDLIVWPETAIPWLLDNAEEPLRMIAEAAAETPVVLGVRRQERARLYNSMILLDALGQVAAVYDKHHLVPFGEYVPLGDLAARVGIHGLAAGEGDGFSAGPGARLMVLPGIGPALPLICYEAVFPQDVAAAPSRPRLLLQITNDAWFGRFSGPFQHLQQARMRAIEQGLPLLRVANTGVSAMIGPKGEVTREIPLGEAGFADALLPEALPLTLYARSGDWPVLALVVLGLLAAGLRRRRCGFSH